MGKGSLQEIFAAGKDTLFSDVVELAGGQNALGETHVSYPRLSTEGILKINPDVIVDLIPDFKEKKLSIEQIKSEWEDVKRTDAVKNGRVYVLGSDYVVIPGPRIFLLVEEVAKLLHPGADWSDK